MSFDGKSVVRWAGLWRAKNRLDGSTEHLLFDNCLPVLFRTRKEARKWIDQKYGYIRTRPDLKAEPSGWKHPIPVRVTIRVGQAETGDAA